MEFFGNLGFRTMVPKRPKGEARTLGRNFVEQDQVLEVSPMLNRPITEVDFVLMRQGRQESFVMGSFETCTLNQLEVCSCDAGHFHVTGKLQIRNTNSIAPKRIS